jgi:hypothetical protein
MKIINLNKRGKNNLLILIVMIASFTIYYTIMSMISPSKKLAEIEKDIGNKPAESGSINDRVFSDSSWLKLLTARSYLLSRLAMAVTDSNYLTINLSDSTANVEINGVVVHTSKISSAKVSKILNRGNPNIVQSLFSSPLRIINDHSTIQKEPVMIKIAPRDTSEYKPDIMPDTSVTEPVNYILDLNNGMRICVYQEEVGKLSDRMNILIFDIADRFRCFLNSLKRVMLLKVPEYQPYIKIKIPGADAKIIYRAIPQHGQIGISI